MKPRLQVSKAALALIKAFEGYRRSSARLADGRWTIGYGHTLTAREGVDINESDAEALLIYDLLAIGGAVNDLTYTPLTQNQFDALAAFAFNVGLDAFRASNVLKLVNEGALLEAAHALEAWRKADFEGESIVVDALIRRRAAEKALFLTPEKGFVPIPSAVVTPRLDDEAVFARTVALTAPLQGGEAVAIRDAAASVPLPLVLSPSPPDEPPPAAPKVEASPGQQGELTEMLYEIPGYGTAKTVEPVERPWSNLSLPKLALLGAAGLGLLGLSFVLAVQGAAATGAGKIVDYGLGAAAGLTGAACVFYSIYQILNRFDRDE